MMYFVVALPAEARPLVDFYRLSKKTTLGGFSIYRGNDKALVVSGPGKVMSAAATALLAANSTPGEQAAWVNIGIAGHATCAIGQSLLAHRITDHATGRSWYPPQLFDLQITNASLLTVDVPENNYHQNAACDMEASGYYSVASRFSSSELVQSFKVISDNRRHSTATVTAQGCTQLIARKLDEIDRLVQALDSLMQETGMNPAAHADLGTVTDQWHFTVSQQHQLTELARRWKVLIPGQPLWLNEFDEQRNATQVLHCLKRHLDAIPPGLQPPAQKPRV